jgi:polyhydroxyalkanoate synthase
MSVSAGTDAGGDELESSVRCAQERAIARNIPGLAPFAQSASDLDVGPTPREWVYSNETAQLYHYRSTRDDRYRRPVLLVMSPLAKGYILDLAKGQSLTEYLLNQGHDVYMLEWAAPRRDQSHLALDNYVLDLLGGGINAVLRDSGEPDITLLGYCLGGMLSCMYSALNVGGPVRNVTCFTTPVNAAGLQPYQRWLTAKSFDIDRLVSELGNIPGDFINNSLQPLRPLQRRAAPMQLSTNAADDDFVKAHLRFDRWTMDQLPVAGALARDLVKEFIVENKFVRNTLTLRGSRVDLGAVKVPFLHVAARHDHIVPAAASRELLPLLGSQDKNEIVINGGHVSLVAGGNAMFHLWPQLDHWLSVRDV